MCTSTRWYWVRSCRCADPAAMCTLKGPVTSAIAAGVQMAGAGHTCLSPTLLHSRGWLGVLGGQTLALLSNAKRQSVPCTDSTPDIFLLRSRILGAPWLWSPTPGARFGTNSRRYIQGFRPPSPPSVDMCIPRYTSTSDRAAQHLCRTRRQHEQTHRSKHAASAQPDPPAPSRAIVPQQPARQRN